MELLRKTYHNDWLELLRDFEPAPGVENWLELEQHGFSFCARAATASTPNVVF